MAEAIVIKFLTGAVPGFEVPTSCYSGKPKPNTCHEPRTRARGLGARPQSFV